MRLNRIIALLTLAVLPLAAVPGWDCRQGWEIILIWVAAAGVSFALTSWWRRVFAWCALAVLIASPAGIAYVSIAMIALVMIFMELVKEENIEDVAGAMVIGAWALFAVMCLQQAGLIPIYNKFSRPAAMFNPGTAGVYLALCLPAFFIFTGSQWGRAFAIGAGLYGIAMTHNTTAIAAAAAGIITYGVLKRTRAANVLVLASLLVVLFVIVKLDPIGRTLNQDPRWRIWQITTRAIEPQPWGRGLGSFQEIFPYYVASSTDLTKTIQIGAIDGKPILMADVWWNYAHNEYLQAAFEMGYQTLALIILYLAWMGWTVIRCRSCMTDRGRAAAAGMAALAVSCLGWFPFHVVPTALVGAAWIGLMEMEIGEARREKAMRGVFGPKTGPRRA